MSTETSDTTTAGRNSAPLESFNEQGVGREDRPSLLDFQVSDIRSAWGIAGDKSNQSGGSSDTSGESPYSRESTRSGESPQESISFDTQKLYDKAQGGDSSPGARPEELSSAAKPEGLSGSSTEQERTKHLARPENRLSPNVGDLWNPENRVLTIGDQHLTRDIKQHTIDNMPEYARAGAKVIGMELFPKNSQPLLDRYFAQVQRDPSGSEEDTKNLRAQIGQVLRSSQESPDDTAEDRMRAAPAIEMTIQIIDAASRAGIRPLAIEPNISRPFATDSGYSQIHEGMRNLPSESQPDFEKYTNPNSSPEERRTARQALEGAMQRNGSSPGKTAGFFERLDEAREANMNFSGLEIPRPDENEDQAWTARLHDVRNRTWANEINDYVRNHPGDRALLFAGAQHFQYGRTESAPDIPSANERLAEHGVKSTVLQFAGGDFTEHAQNEFDNLSEFYARQNGIERGADGKYPAPPDSAMSSALRYTEPARQAGVASQNFAIKIAPQGAREGDYVIHLPQR